MFYMDYTNLLVCISCDCNQFVYLKLLESKYDFTNTNLIENLCVILF